MILYEFFFKVNKVMLLFIIKSIKLFINVEWIFWDISINESVDII